ncbi:MAG: DUF3794 domain-containing protein [Negativicutes bacterium]|nr:DUF3794 domain-containing protein [Negativicutes bacterium]
MSDKTRQSSGSTTTTSVTSAAGPAMAADAEAACGTPQLGPETIQVEQVLGADMQQRVVEFAMVVPDPKPDIEQIIDVYIKKLEVTSINVIPDKVVVRGTLEVKVLYVADLPNQPLHACEQDNVHWTRDISIEGAQPGMKATADVVAEYINYDFDPADPRQVYVTIVLKVWTRVVTTTDMDVYTLTPVNQGGQTEVTSASAAETLAAGMAPAPAPSNVVVTPGVAPTAGTNLAASGMAMVNASGVNVRTGPGTNFPVVTQVNKGNTVTIKDQAFGWYKVVLSDGNTTGWIAGWLLNVGGAAAANKG